MRGRARVCGSILVLCAASVTVACGDDSGQPTTPQAASPADPAQKCATGESPALAAFDLATGASSGDLRITSLTVSVESERCGGDPVSSPLMTAAGDVSGTTSNTDRVREIHRYRSVAG